MILIDANILLYAKVEGLPHHDRSRSWLDTQLNGDARVGLPWPALLTFVRLSTNRRIFERACSIDDAWAVVEDWLGCEPVWIPQPTERHQGLLSRFVKEGAIRSDLVMDAHLAALAIEHGLTLCSTDRDFARFPGLRWENPISKWSVGEPKGPGARAVTAPGGADRGARRTRGGTSSRRRSRGARS